MERRLRLVTDAAEGLQERATESVEAVTEQIETAAQGIAEAARAASETLSRWSRDGATNARSAVQEQPVLWSLISLGIVAAVGVAATWWTSRDTGSSRQRRARISAAHAQLRTRQLSKSEQSSTSDEGAQAKKPARRRRSTARSSARAS